jgi:2-polyprenyl-3-methyl-5-hydroxy-6-metoxy-1,4-benzoquinol methylase
MTVTARKDDTDDLVATIDAFWEKRAKVPDITAGRFHPEYTPYDMALIEPHLFSGARMLDLGAGTCVLANALAARGDVYVHAVDKQADMLRHAASSPMLTTEVADAAFWRAEKTFDLILLFGLINSFPSENVRHQIYQNCFHMLAPKGVLVLKSQMGVQQTILVNKFSEELGMHYGAIYPEVEREEQLLKSLFVTEKIDPYPAAYNRWPNTHFYAFKAHRRSSSDGVV